MNYYIPIVSFNVLWYEYSIYNFVFVLMLHLPVLSAFFLTLCTWITLEEKYVEPGLETWMTTFKKCILSTVQVPCLLKLYLRLHVLPAKEI